MVSFINGGACFVNGGGYFVNGGGSFINSGGSFTNGGGYFINSGGSFINGGGSFVNGGSTWDIYTPSIPANNDIKFVDIDIDIANSYKIYACTNGTSGVPAEIWSIDIITNLPWSKITTITDMGFAKPQIDFSSLEPSNIFIAYRDNATTNNLVIKKSIDGGVNWSTIFNNTNSSLNVHLRPWGNSKWMFEMSEIDINTIYFSANVMFRKTANAPGFFAFSQYIPDENPYSTYADVRDLEIKKNSSNDNDILLIGHDGGLARTYEGLSATVREWNNLNGNTLNNSEFYGFDYYPTGDDIIGGLQDNGGFHKKTGNWNIIFNNADGAMALVNKEDENISYIVQNGGGYNAILKSTKKENYLEIDINYPEPSINGLKSFPMILDPTNNNFLWYGVYDLHRYDSKNNSWFTFNSSSLGTGADGNFSSIAIAPANNQIIYAAYEHPQWDNNLDAIKLIRSLDGGTTFTDLTIHTNTNNPFIYAGITEIIVDPNNYNHLFVATNGNNNKVYEVTVSGNSITWSDLSAGILQDAKVFSLNY